MKRLTRLRRNEGLPDFTKGVPVLPISSSRPIPLAYSLLSAGPAVGVCDDGYALLDVNKLVTGGREGCLAYEVTGDSMREDILPGYIVIVDPHKEVRNGDTILVHLNGQNCVKILEQAPQRLRLISKNSDYEPRDVRADDYFHVLGVVRSHIAVYC